MHAMRNMMDRLKLTVNADKTRICRVPDESFDFLGYTIGRWYSAKTGKAYIGTRPSKKRVAQLLRAISDATSRRWLWTDVQDRVRLLNQMMIGWANYFCLGPVDKAYRAVEWHARRRLRQWLCRKHQLRGMRVSRYSLEYLHGELGLARLKTRKRNFPWAKA